VANNQSHKVGLLKILNV